MSEQMSTEIQQAQCLVLAGGKGSRLHPLADAKMPKPSLQLGDSNMLIDPALQATSEVASEVIVACRGDERIRRHLERHYNTDIYTEGQETEQRETGYVVFDNRERLYGNSSDTLIVTPADHLHAFDLAAALGHHLASGADITILGINIATDEAEMHDVLELHKGEVVGFMSKPYERRNGETSLVSVGTYIFRKDTMLELLNGLDQKYPGSCDIGYDLLPRCFRDYGVNSFTVTGCWQDLGTIDRYYAGNMSLLDHPDTPVARQLNLHIAGNEKSKRNLIAPSSIISNNAEVSHSIVGEGAIIEANTVIENAIILPHSVVAAGTYLRHAILGEGATVQPRYATTLITDREVSVVC